MSATTIQPAPARWLRRGLLLLAALVVLLIAVFILSPVSVLATIATAALRLRGIESRYVQLGPNRIHYFVGGTGEPLVLVHGLGSRALDFALLMPGLAREHRVYALDLLGYGDSDRPEVDYSVSLQTGVLRQFVDTLRLERVDLAGLSMGGWITLAFTAESPDRVRRLVLMDSAGMNFTPSFDLRLFTPRTTGDVEALARLLTPRPPRVPAFINRDVSRVLREESWVIQRTIDNMMAGRELLDGKLGDVTMPVLLIWGKQDVVTPVFVGEAMHREMPQSVMVVLDGCGHVTPIECHDRVLAEMQRFLDANPPLPAGVREE
jgi:pimeloyl-ACP methyl ester carboxylesterase